MITNPRPLLQKEYRIVDEHLLFDNSYVDYNITIKSKSIYIYNNKKNKVVAEGIKDIQTISFRDLKNIDIHSQKSYPVSDIIDVNGEGQYLIKATEIIANDIDFHNNIIEVYNVFGAVGGVVTLNSENNLVFEKAPGYQGLMSFSYNIINSENEITQGDNLNVWLRTPELPKDPNFFDQWYLQASNIIPVWEYYTGKNITVAIFDQGFVPLHPDIISNLVGGNSIFLSDVKEYAHALGVGSVIAATRNDIDLVGIAYDAKITSYSTPTVSEYQMPYLSDPEEVDLKLFKEYEVINNSWGWFSEINKLSRYFIEGYKIAAKEGRDGLGSIVVFSSGNQKTIDVNLDPYMVSPYVAIVGGMNKMGSILSLENEVTEFATGGSSVLVSAPASNFPTLNMQDCEIDPNMRVVCDYTILNVKGTSFAAPIVSAISALMLEANPHLGFRDVQEILSITSTATMSDTLFQKEKISGSSTEINDSIFQLNHASNWNNGGMHYARSFGFGGVNANAAVKLAESWTIQQTSNNFISYSSMSSNRLEDLIKTDENLVTSFVIEQNFDIEFVEATINIGKFQPVGSEFYLQSPSGTLSIILRNEKCDASNLGDKSIGAFKVKLASTNFRGEQSKGQWAIKVKGDSTCVGPIKAEKKEDLINDFGLKLYGKKTAATELYFTDEFLLFKDRSDIKEGYKTINAAAVSGSVKIDLTGKSNSNILGKQIYFDRKISGVDTENITSWTEYEENNASWIVVPPIKTSIVNIKLGDGDDKLIGTIKDNIFMPGRGENFIHTGGGKDVIYFPNLKVHAGNTVIDDFRPQETKIQFGHNISFDDIDLLITANEEGVSIKGEAWSIELPGLDSIKSEDFIFADLFF